MKSEKDALILSGVESSDFNSWSVGGMLAELLDVPSVSAVSSLNIETSNVVVTREIEGGKQTVTATVPSVLIVQKGIAIIPRIPSMRGIMTARTKPLKVVQGIASQPMVKVLDLQAPAQKSSCRMIDPENMEELVELLHKEARVI